MDISDTLAPKSDQQNYDDYLAHPKTVTISEVKAGSAEQPVEIHLTEYPGRPYKPSKSMRRVIVAAWGSESSVYAGRRMTLMGDPTVKFGGQTVGGIKIAALSHIDKPLSVSLTVTRGKRAPFIVQPLPDAAPTPTPTPTPTPQATIDGALNAIRNAPDLAALDAIETKANGLGIGDHVKAAIAEKRGELATDNQIGNQS